MAFQTPFLFRGYKTEWFQFFLYLIMIHVKNQHMPAFQLLENHLWSWVMSHGSFLKNLDLCLTCGSYTCDMHILWIRILRQFFCPHFFFETAHAKFWKLIFSETRGQFFFSFSNSDTTQNFASNDIWWHKVYSTHAHAERTLNLWDSLTPTLELSKF